MYQLHFISIEAIADLNNKISKGYKGKVADIVKKILIEDDELSTKKKVNIEDTLNKTRYISNFWSPVKNINYVTETSANKNGSAGYLFFENRKGFNFVSTESLMQAPQVQEFIYDQYMRDIGPDGRSTRNVEEEYKRIIDIDIPTVFNYMDRARSGMFASRMITYRSEEHTSELQSH